MEITSGKNSEFKTNKKLIGNEKRLLAENAKRLAQKANIATVQQALKNIDTGSSGLNKKIVFPDESDGELPENSIANPQKDVNQLFSDDSDQDDDDKPDEPSFHVREQFEGEKGQKLFELHSKFNNDTRFKIDKRFLEEDKVENHATDETIRSVDVDSDGEETEKLEDEPKSNGVDKEKEADVKNKYYFAVSENLTNLFASKEKPKFSMFGNQEENDSWLQKEEKQLTVEENKPNKRFKVNSETEVKAIPGNPFKPSGWFFIRPGDECLKEGCKFFCRQDTEEDMRAKWKTFRPSILEGFKKLKKGHGKPKSKWKQVSKNHT